MSALPERTASAIISSRGDYYRVNSNSSLLHKTEVIGGFLVQAELLKRNLTREDIELISGFSNGDDLIHRLRGRGLEIPLVTFPAFDRNWEVTTRRVYSVTDADRISMMIDIKLAHQVLWRHQIAEHRASVKERVARRTGL